MEKILTKEVISTILIITISTLFYMTLKKIINQIFMKKSKRESKRALTVYSLSTNIIKYIIIIVDLLMILDVWGVNTKSLVASLGILGLVAGLALQDLLKDFIGGVSILTENQFKVGDNVEIEGFRGTVIALGMKTTKIRSYTGEVKFIANRNITEVINYTMMPLKCIVDVPTSYNDDPKKVEKVLKQICEKLTKSESYLKSEVELLGVQELADSSVNFRIIADTKFDDNANFKRKLLKEIIIEFNKNNLTIPFPQLEVHSDKSV